MTEFNIGHTKPFNVEHAKAQPTERNFCERCGKRLHEGSIHTCTPPEEASEPIMFGSSLVENMQIDVLCMHLTENTSFDGAKLEKTWNELVQFYVKHRNSPTSSQPVLPAAPESTSGLVRLGQYVTDFAKRQGWDEVGAEGAFEFIQRKSYAQGIEDGRCNKHQSMPSAVPEPDYDLSINLGIPVYLSPIPQDLLVRVREALEACIGLKHYTRLDKAFVKATEVLADIRKLEGK